VARHYEALGYEVLSRNWRCREGELDLVLRRGRTLVVCEVKTRTSTAFGTPAEAVTRTKQQKLRLLTRRYLQSAPFRPGQIRFDVAAVLAGDLTLIENAF
jgi:putative endonuclease